MLVGSPLMTIRLDLIPLLTPCQTPRTMVLRETRLALPDLRTVLPPPLRMRRTKFLASDGGSMVKMAGKATVTRWKRTEAAGMTTRAPRRRRRRSGRLVPNGDSNMTATGDKGLEYLKGNDSTSPPLTVPYLLSKWMSETMQRSL